MKKNYLKSLLLALGLVSATQAMAVKLPYAQAPEDGKTYMLVSRLKPNSYVVPTSWDGALYLQGYNLDNITSAAVTAKQNEDGTWTFYKETTTTDEFGESYTNTTYMGFPGGTDNLRIQEYSPVAWQVEKSDVDGYYLLKAGEGQGNVLTIGGYLHLNNGGEYLVISETSNYYFPDFYGGVQVESIDEETGETGDYIFDEAGFVVPKNTISRYWAFVELDNVPAYSEKVQLYVLLQDIEDNYLTLEGYADGFKNAYDAALAYYNKDEFTAEDLAAAKVIIDSKNALYKEILTAKNLLGENTDADLTAAIAAATKVFNEQSDAEVLAAAKQTLNEAEIVFARQGSDMTALGKNMSFEDLTSQNGSMTTGVEGAPTGWNIYINGKKVETASEVRAAGITAWHGINDDADGKEGNYVFGIWNSGIPEYEISQTISGLENGSYTIAAAVMVGANGNGSRRTTQRIFGNLNSKYFATEYEYNPERLDQSEVYGFEGLEEIQTDRQLQEMSVRAFVYDGTLTFGLRTNGDIAAANRDASNGAGGDGWFKLDNFRIMKEGYIEDDALAVYDHFKNIYGTLGDQQMQKDIKNKLEELTKGNIGAGASQEEIINAIVGLKDIYAEVKQSVDAYSSLNAAIEKGTAALVTYQYSASADDFGDMLMDITNAYEDAEIGLDEINAYIAQIDEGIAELQATSITLGDVTYIIQNPSFEDLSAQGNSPSDGAVHAPAGWTLYVNGEEAETVSGGWCAINHGDNIGVELEDGTVINHQYTDGEYLWGIWNSNIPEVELSQTFKNMPVGTYKLEADVMIQHNWAGDNTTTQRIFGNNNVQMWGTEDAYSELNLPEDAKNAGQLTYAGYVCAPNQYGYDNSDLLHPMEVTFAVGEDRVAKIGFRTNGVNAEGLTYADGGLNGQGWFKVDNFRLTYVSENPADGIQSTSVAGNGLTKFYSIDGRALNAPQRGINIMKTTDQEGNVKTVKVLVK